MDNILSIYGYGISKKDNEKIIEKIKKDLTMTPKSYNDEESKIFKIFTENDKRLYVPRYYGLKKFGLCKNKLNKGEYRENLIFNGKLREQQLEPVNNFIKIANDPLKMGGIISVPCGFGKTIMSVYIACHFKVKTMFVSHKDFLNQQFLESVKTFVPNASIGIIKQSKIDVKNKDIIIASLQSLAVRDYDMDIFKDIGLVIIDEVHHLGAEIFCRAFKKLNVPIILGLSATLDRKDGMRKIFEYHIGESVYEYNKKEKIDVNVEIHKYYKPDIEYSGIKLLWNGKPNMASMINNICNYEPRNDFIIKIIEDILKKENKRQILILSERRNQLKILENKLIEKKIIDIGYYVGGLTQKDLDISSSKQIILATYQMAAEGMNIPTLNTLILSSPINDIQQSIGRILREKPNERKYIPYCIDIWDEFSLFTRKGYTRIKYYNNNEYKTSYFVDREPYIYKKEEKYNFIEE